MSLSRLFFNCWKLIDGSIKAVEAPKPNPSLTATYLVFMFFLIELNIQYLQSTLHINKKMCLFVLWKFDCEFIFSIE